ncbi:hypothetical protein [Ammoniphilus sp. YIM 78166]|uniref:hypothetical protein n=1 Tax=Ammoniphilus sp. YIM 78166 TaxID=1644106 RepID=UPI00106F5394|nr:hypothetical protein [Ammoniphilus sp. YIM 78166]
MKKWISCLTAGVLTLSLLGCQQEEMPASTSPAEVTLPANGQDSQTAPQEASAEPRIYQNSVDGYLLDLPKEWANVKVIEASRSADFLYPSANPEANQSLMRIVGMSVEEWEKVKSEDSPSAGQLKEITQIDGSMYFYVLPLDQILEGKELEEYNAMVKQIPDIIFNFRVENK